MGILGWLGGKRQPQQAELSQDEERRVQKQCSATRSALWACRRAHPDNNAASDRLEARLVECYSRSIACCQAQAEAFETCYNVAAHTLAEAEFPNCDQQLGDMKLCLKSVGKYPFSIPPKPPRSVGRNKQHTAMVREFHTMRFACGCNRHGHV